MGRKPLLNIYQATKLTERDIVDPDSLAFEEIYTEDQFDSQGATKDASVAVYRHWFDPPTMWQRQAVMALVKRFDKVLIVPRHQGGQSDISCNVFRREMSWANFADLGCKARLFFHELDRDYVYTGQAIPFLSELRIWHYFFRRRQPSWYLVLEPQAIKADYQEWLDFLRDHKIDHAKVCFIVLAIDDKVYHIPDWLNSPCVVVNVSQIYISSQEVKTLYRLGKSNGHLTSAVTQYIAAKKIY